MIRIDKIDWLSEQAKEAEVHLSDGNFNIVCFSHPFNHFVGDRLSLPVYALNVRDIYRVNDRNFLIEKTLDFGYRISGCVLNNNQIKVGTFIIEIDSSLPNDIQINNYISFVCDRIDLY